MATTATTSRTPRVVRLLPVDVDHLRVGRTPGWFVLGLTWVFWPLQVGAWSIEPSVAAELTVTSNGRFESRSEAEGDVVLNTRLGVAVREQGAGLRVNGDFSLNAVNYTRGTQGDRVLPSGYLNLDAELLERWLLLDASLLSQQTSQDVLGVRADSSSTVNRLTVNRARLAPRLQRELSATRRVRIGTDQSWTRTSGDGADASLDAHVQQHLMRIESDPRPLGWSAEFKRDETTYRDQSDPALQQDAVRLVGSYLWDQQVQFGVVLGNERIRTQAESERSTLYGVDLAWRPDERTDISARIERRSFGLGWEGRFTHRTPTYAFNLGFSRRPTTYSQTLGTVEPGGNIRGLLDAALTTRVPDPVERSRLVGDLIASRGLPTTLAEPLSIVAAGAQLARSFTASVVFTGARNTLSLAAYAERLEGLTLDEQSLLGPRDATRQHGAAIEWNRRLTPQTTLALLARWSINRTLSLLSEGSARDLLLSTSFMTNLSPRTAASLGLRRQTLDSSTSGRVRETALVVGIDHRF